MKFGRPLPNLNLRRITSQKADASSIKSMTTEDSIDVVIEINEKTSVEEPDSVEVADKGITIKVNDKVVSLEQSASADEGKKFVDDLQQAVEEVAHKEKQETSNTNVLGRLMFWKSAEKPAEDEKKEEEPASEEEPQEQEQKQDEPVEQPEEAEPAPEAEAEAETEAVVIEKEQAPCGPFGFLQDKLTFWQNEASKEPKEEEQPVPEEPKEAEDAEPAETESEKKEAVEDSEQTEKKVEEEVFSHKIEVFVDGVAIQTIRLTNAGMGALNTFITSVQEEARSKGASASDAVTNSWIVAKMSEFFESAKDQGDVVVQEETPTPPVEEEQEHAEIETQTAKSNSWWPFSKSEEKVVVEVRNETTVEKEVTEDTRELAEAA